MHKRLVCSSNMYGGMVGLQKHWHLITRRVRWKRIRIKARNLLPKNLLITCAHKHNHMRTPAINAHTQCTQANLHTHKNTGFHAVTVQNTITTAECSASLVTCCICSDHPPDVKDLDFGGWLVGLSMLLSLLSVG